MTKVSWFWRGARSVVGVLIITASMLLTCSRLVFASNETVSASATATTEIKTATPITGITINGTGNDTVPVKLLVTSGTLAMSTTTGLTFTGNQTGSTLYFSGTRSDVNAALATLTYTRNTLGTDTLEISLVSSGEVFFSGTNHLYEYVSSTLTWGAAKTAAEGRSKYGATGYLATITSQAENDFVSARLTNAGWMGASDVTTESVWKWVTGPENGTTFSNGNSPNMVAASGQYQNWNNGEPNDSGANEDCGQFLSGGSGKWNDLPCSGTTLPGYVVEYGAPGNLPTVAAANVSLTTVDTVNPTTPGTPTTTTPTNDQTPSWSWTASTDAGSGLANPGYSLQWSQSSSFASGNYSGTSNTNSYTHSTNLADGTWYFRVRSNDQGSNSSPYSSSGSVLIDTTAPSVPGLSATTTKTQNNTPTISWTQSSDSGAGLANPAYTVQYSQSSSFASGNTSVTTNATTFTSPALTDGTWYFRVRSSDQLGAISAWSPTATIIIDTTLPTVPGTPSTATPTNTKKPTWNWAGSSDNGTGLGNPAYSVQWSQSSNFSSGVQTGTSTNTSFTQPTDLTDGVWYFRVAAIDDVTNTSSYSSVGSVTIDTAPPMVSSQASQTISSSSQVISWTTDKLSSSRVRYGPSTTYDSSTNETNTSPRVTSHAVTLSGLSPCVLYHYSVESVDALGNQVAAPDKTFLTPGCAGDAAVESYAENMISTSSGGSVSLPTAVGTVTVTAPTQFSSMDAAFQIKQIDKAATLTTTSTPKNLVVVGGTYDLKAMQDSTTSITGFNQAVSVTLPYTSTDIVNVVESSLAIYRWDNPTSGWERLLNCHVSVSNKIVTCDTPGFSTFAVFGSQAPVTPASTTRRTTESVSMRSSDEQTGDVQQESPPETSQSEPKISTTTNVNSGELEASTRQPRWWLLLSGLLLMGLFFIILLRRRKDDNKENL